MASSSKVDPDHSITSSSPIISTKLSRMDLILRILLFVKTLAAIIVMVTSKQKKDVFPAAHLVVVAKFDHSSAFIYFVVAISVACLYSLVTAVRSAIRPYSHSRTLFFTAFFDALIFGVVASAVGAAASIAYVGAKGNPHVGWSKICNLFDKFCKHIGGSLILSVSASITLIFLMMISTFSLYRRSR
ncbi:CASP-like protein 1D1 [Dendrobium catenatum]|uniref:CASP-like protein 1D1 n=1 Tax=Dendrobium catenatum TaxID=906689 RepID=UPI0010A0B7D2|nr:CASP-like protein 1D1 [Dendrobium catenatum]